MSDREFKSKMVAHRYGRVRALLEELAVLPTSMHVPMRILALQRSPSSTMELFAEAISFDPSLTAKVLAMANSTWFCPREPVYKISQAVPRIGLNNLLPLLFGVSIAGLFNRADLPSSERAVMWRTSLLKATVAGAWAGYCAPQQVEEAFVCALMQDIALPIMSAADRAAAMELALVLEMEQPDVRVEREVALYGSDHCELGTHLATRMGLPELIVQSVRWHHLAHDDPRWPANLRPLAPALALAASVPHVLTRPDVPAVSRRLEKSFAIVRAAIPEAPELHEFLTLAVDRFTAVSRSMGDTPELGDGFKNFLQDVCGELASRFCGVLGESAKTIDSLRTANSYLEGRIFELDHDVLTGAFNRRGFLTAAREALSTSRPAGGEPAVAVIDLDDLIPLNQQYDRVAGDAALIHVAGALPQALQQYGVVVGRLDAGAFALALVPPSAATDRNTLRRDLARALASLRLGVQNSAPLSLSFSVGLVWVGAGFVPSSGVEQVLARAEQLMAEAKRSGKGRLREADAATPQAA